MRKKIHKQQEIPLKMSRQFLRLDVKKMKKYLGSKNKQQTYDILIHRYVLKGVFTRNSFRA